MSSLDTLTQGDGGFLGVHEVSQPEGNICILAGRRDHISALAHVAIYIIAASLHAVRALERGHGDAGSVKGLPPSAIIMGAPTEMAPAKGMPIACNILGQFFSFSAVITRNAISNSE